MLTDDQLNHMRSFGTELEELAQDEIRELRAAYALLFKRDGHARAQIDTLRRLLGEAESTKRHPDYDWPTCLIREVEEALRA